jgi:ubiquinone/menaquinone biosynthesis C-methylase UbiE
LLFLLLGAQLSEPAESQDALLLFGPLYHLTEPAQRRQALTEAWRVLRSGGRLLAMAVCRFASLDGLYAGWLDDRPRMPLSQPPTPVRSCRRESSFLADPFCHGGAWIRLYTPAGPCR